MCWRFRQIWLKNSEIPFNKLKITHNYLIFLFYYIFLVTFSSLQVLKTWYLIILRVSRLRGDVMFEQLPSVEAAAAWNRGIPCKKLPNIYTFSLFQVPKSWYLIVWRFLRSKMWGSLVKKVGHWGRYGLKQGNSLNMF